MSFRFEQDLMEHAKTQAVKKRKQLTTYIEEAVAEKSNFKPKLKTK